MLIGHQTWCFPSKPCILGTGTVGGPFEANGAISEDFDLLHDDLWIGQESFEKAEKKLMEEACEIAIQKSGLKKEDISFYLSGDLLNQIISSSFSARTLKIPFLGIYGACSSSMEGLSLASMLIDSGFANTVLASTSSHNGAAEKQYRYPTEYGAQKPPTAQWTVTGSGAVVVGKSGDGPQITHATIGKVTDLGISDPFNMGVCMAPAAVDTILAHFRDLDLSHDAYDLIVTGDLGKVGHTIARDLLKKYQHPIPDEKFFDCGLLIYREEQPAMAGGSGCACAAVTTYGHLLNRMNRGEFHKILVIATGALLSPISYQQKESIPCIAHAVSIERPQ